jgi:phospholipase C
VAKAQIGLLAGGGGAATPPPAGLDQIQHIVVIYLENWSFDSLYGEFPGADGLAQAASAPLQVDQNGQPYSELPQVLATAPGTKPTNPLGAENAAIAKPPVARPPDPRFPVNLPNRPFALSPYVPPTGKIADPGASFYQEQAEIDGGKMDRFVLDGKSGALPMGWYDASQLPLGRLAEQYTQLDHFFHAASRLPNWTVSGTAPGRPPS